MASGNFVNRTVATLLQSPLHWMLPRSVTLVRYRGRRSGQTFTTPVQCVTDGHDALVLVGKPATKTWWRNFHTEHEVEVLRARRWETMIGHVVVGADEPDVAGPLVARYLERFPKAARALEGGTRGEQVRSAVLVRCTPR